MNCDEAFDRMTSAGSSSDRALDQHLARCTRCREMRDILSPALTAFEELQTDAATSRPAQDGPLLTVEALRIAEQAAQTLPMRTRRHTAWSSLVSMALLVLMGVALGAVAVQPEREHPQLATAASETPLLTACLWSAPKPASAEPARKEQSPQNVILSCVMCHVQ